MLISEFPLCSSAGFSEIKAVKSPDDTVAISDLKDIVEISSKNPDSKSGNNQTINQNQQHAAYQAPVMVALSDQTSSSDAKKYKISTMKITEENKLYSLDAQYPELTNCPSGEVKEGFNKWVKTYIDENIKEFVKNSEETSNIPSTPSFMGIGYHMASETGRFVSLNFGINTYYSGTAHPSNDVATLTYDLEKNKPVILSDLFMNKRKDAIKYDDIFKLSKDEFLEEISDYCIKDLKRQSSDAGTPPSPWMEEGAGPKADNFKNFTLNKDSLEIFFGEYQVGCHAEGMKSVIIPYDKLKDYINPDGPIGELAPRINQTLTPEEAKKSIEVNDNEIIIDGIKLNIRK